MGMGLYGLSAILLFRRSDGPTTGVVISSPTAGVVQFMLNRIDGPATGGRFCIFLILISML